MHFEQQEQLPPLIPINKKRDLQTPQPLKNQQKSKLQSTKPKTQDRNELTSQLQKKPSQQLLSNRQQKQSNIKTPKSNVNDKKIQQFSQKFKNLQDKSSLNNKKTNKKSQQQKKQQNQKSKFLIAQMLNKISVKNISQQLYPITNQTIQNVIFQMQQQIRLYKLQAQKKQNTLLTNPNNQHLKVQITNLQKSIDHCQTIKALYHEKINFRNKVAILQGKIIQLRTQNRDLKIKVSRGIQKIQNHMHNLPCEKQKQLRQELNKCTQQLTKQKQMRINLQNNIQDIIMNFKRLYQQADTARLIVTKKLRQIQQRQKLINQAKLQYNSQAAEDQNNSTINKRSPKIDYFDDRKNPKNNFNQSENSTQRLRLKQRPQKDQNLNRNDRVPTTNNRDIQRTTASNINKNVLKQQPKPMSFEDSIRKMRANQNMFSKIYTKQ